MNDPMTGDRTMQHENPCSLKPPRESTSSRTRPKRSLRRPRGGATLMAIRQANVAEQHIVQTSPDAVAQGAQDVGGQGAIAHTEPAPEAALSPLGTGAGVAEEVCVTQSAVGEQHGAA